MERGRDREEEGRKEGRRKRKGRKGKGREEKEGWTDGQAGHVKVQL